MTARRSCPAAPGPLEGYAARFADLFTRVAQRRGFRECLAGLPAPRARKKTLTARAAPARQFAKGKNDPAFRTKLAIGADLAVQAREAGFAFCAVVADSAYGDQDGFRAELAEAGLPFVMALRPHRGTWARDAGAHTPVDAARALAWGGLENPGDWHPVTRTFRDGHAETWRAADATLGGWGPDGARRL